MPFYFFFWKRLNFESFVLINLKFNLLAKCCHHSSTTVIDHFVIDLLNASLVGETAFGENQATPVYLIKRRNLKKLFRCRVETQLGFFQTSEKLIEDFEITNVRSWFRHRMLKTETSLLVLKEPYSDQGYLQKKHQAELIFGF